MGFVGFLLSLVFINNMATAAKYLAPLFSFCVFLRWEPIFECFALESLGAEIAFEAVNTAYLMWVVGTSGQFDAIAVSIWGVALNMVWIFLQLVHLAQTTRYSRRMLASVPALFAAFMGTFFWTLQTSATCGSDICRQFLGTIAVCLLLVQPTTSVINRMHSRIPDDLWEPYIIKMVVSGVAAVTSTYSVWSQYMQGYKEQGKDKLWWLFLMSCFSTAVALAENALRYIGPLRVSDWVKEIFHGVVPKLKGLFSGQSCVPLGCWFWIVSY